MAVAKLQPQRLFAEENGGICGKADGASAPPSIDSTAAAGVAGVAADQTRLWRFGTGPVTFMFGAFCTLAILSLRPHAYLAHGGFALPWESTSGFQQLTAIELDARGSLPQPSRRLRLPWEPLLTQLEVQRGLSYYGSGGRLRAVAAKLLAGRPIKAYTLGGSVTFGKGASGEEASYASRFFQFLNATFPHRDHEFMNKGMGATGSGVFAACLERMVPQDVDLVVTEFSRNDAHDAPFSHPARRAYEQLLRKLLALPGAPAVLQLHHYAWWHPHKDGVGLDSGLFYEWASESQLSVVGQYYDLPAVSLRAAVFPLMQAGVTGFKADRVLDPINLMTQHGVPEVQPGTEGSYFFADKTHPADGGHKVLAELLAAAVLRAVGEVEAAGGPGEVAPYVALAAAWPTAFREDERLAGLPPPMVPGNDVLATTLCAIQEAFKPMVVSRKGFRYRAEQPGGENFVAQKWGWSAFKPGDWVEMEFDSRDSTANTGSDALAAGTGSAASPALPTGTPLDTPTWVNGTATATAPSSPSPAPARPGPASVYLNYLCSYSGGMGTAAVTCVSGCSCKASVIDGSWTEPVSLRQVHKIRVSQHERCRVRVEVREEAGVAPQDGHKVVLNGLMVSHYTIRLSSNPELVELVESRAGR